MKAFVHFLVRNPYQLDTMIYPTELDGSYQGYPGFFLLEDGAPELRETYAFLAVHNEQLVAIRLDRVVNTRTVYRADVPTIGAFEFRALPLRNASTTVSGRIQFAGMRVLRELKPKRPADLNEAVRDHNFYFVGYTAGLYDYDVSG